MTARAHSPDRHFHDPLSEHFGSKPVRRNLVQSLALMAVLALMVALIPPTASVADDSGTFTWTESTYAEIQDAFDAGELTCVELVQGYLDRIEAFDQQGPTLRSIIAVSDTVLDEAAAKDATGMTGPLHCAPVIVKDNVDVVGMPTTAGSAALAELMPPDDAFIVERLKDAGALVIAKANMDEFAFGGGGFSEIGGQVGNAYDPAQGPGGSSSGTGASIAASFGLLGIGTDTGGSIRGPAGLGALVGLRPSMRLVSQDGIIPLALFQDTAGPMCRTVEDCAVMMEAMAGFDGAETSGQYTLPQQRDDMGVLIEDDAEFAEIVGSLDFVGELDADALDGARIGVVPQLFASSNEDTVAAIDQAIAAMEDAGATFEDVTIEDLSDVNSYASMSGYEFYHHLGGYLANPELTGDFPRTYEELQEEVREALQGTFETRRNNGIDRYNNEVYQANTLERPDFVRDRFGAALDNNTVAGESLGEPFDALLYPTAGNSRPSPFTGFPALNVPAGFTEASDDEVAMPVGLELLGREFDDALLLSLAYAYQETVAGTDLARQAPTTVYELDWPDVPTPPATPTCADVDVPMPFPDVAGSGHDAFISCLAELGVVEGYSDGTFGPTGEVSRAQLASFVVRALEVAGHELEVGESTFPDVGGGAHGDSVLKLASAGVLQGRTDGTFGPWEPVSRQQTATYVAGALELVVGDLATSDVTFPDVTAGATHAQAINKLATAEVISGYTDGTFGPTEPVTRAQMSRFVGNGLDVLAE